MTLVKESLESLFFFFFLAKNDPRRVVIKELRIHIEGRPDIVYTLETKEQVAKLKDTPFTLKEGCRYKTSIKFKVQHELVTGLKHVNTVYKKIIKGTILPLPPMPFLIEKLEKTRP